MPKITHVIFIDTDISVKRLQIKYGIAGPQLKGHCGSTIK